METLPMEEMTLKDLQAEAVSLGLEKVELFRTKAPLIAAINSLRQAKITSDIPAPTPVATLNEPVDPKRDRADDKRWKSKADRMREFLESQPKVRILIPLDTNESQGVVTKKIVNGREEIVSVKGAVWSKSFNGYRVVVPKGVYTDVAEQIAENISNEYNQTMHAGDHLRIDRLDPNTGRPVSDQL